jgi:hypothetical protein
LRLNDMRRLLYILAVALLLAGCANTYFDQFGGYPMDSEFIVINSNSPDIKLLVTYRFPYQEERADSMTINMSVNVIVATPDLDKVSVDMLTVAATDGSYLISFGRPAVYEPNARYPVTRTYTDPDTGERFTPSDQPCLFILDRDTAEYEITLNYRTYKDTEVIERAVRSKIINLRDIKRKSNYL